jgi:GLUG motif-containing protein
MLSDSVAGSGTEEDPFQVETTEQLSLIGKFPCEWDKHFKLVADLDFSEYTGTKFKGIGTTEVPFTGTFDGSGHTISGFNYASWHRVSAGFFGEISSPEAEVRDLRLVEPRIHAYTAYAGVGLLVGYVGDGNIRNCYVDRGSVHSYHGPTGGLVGGTGSGVLTDCYAVVDIASYDAYTGGLVGNNHGVIRNCHSAGSIVSDDVKTGGLVGRNSGEILNCHTQMDIGGQDYTGGLVGDNTLGFVANSYASGAVVGMTHTGGLIGYMSDAEVVGSFWDVEASGQESSAGGTGLATGQMQTAGPFLEAGWDFVGEAENGGDQIWWIDEGQDYPRLWWELLDAEAVE